MKLSLITIIISGLVTSVASQPNCPAGAAVGGQCLPTTLPCCLDSGTLLTCFTDSNVFPSVWISRDCTAEQLQCFFAVEPTGTCACCGSPPCDCDSLSDVCRIDFCPDGSITGR
jgi:hypothetical protein